MTVIQYIKAGFAGAVVITFIVLYILVAAKSKALDAAREDITTLKAALQESERQNAEIRDQINAFGVVIEGLARQTAAIEKKASEQKEKTLEAVINSQEVSDWSKELLPDDICAILNP